MVAWRFIEALVLVIVRMGFEDPMVAPGFEGSSADGELLGHFLLGEKASFSQSIVAGFETVDAAESVGAGVDEVQVGPFVGTIQADDQVIRNG